MASNYAKKRAQIKLVDLKEELNIESAKVLDYGTYNKHELDDVLREFIEDYVDYAGAGRDLYFIYGDSNEINAVAYQDLTTEEVIVSTGTDQETLTSGETTIFSNPGETVTIKIGVDEYTFTLKTGENFYFIISQEVEGEEYVVTS
jgi:hypothetical protein